MHNQPLKILFVINPISGGKEKNDWEAAIRNYFREAPHTMDFYLLTGKEDASSVNHHIDSVKPDRVVAVGGDGTVKMLAELLRERDIPLGILPAGSANGMARELNIPLEPDAALRIITDGECRHIDALEINGQLCIHLSDIGLNALLVKYFEQSNKRGMLGYAQAVFRVLWNKQLMKVLVRTDEVSVYRRAFMVVIANARTYGTGALINPEGDVADGVFEAVVVRRLNLLELLKMLITHKPFHPNRIEVFRTTRLVLQVRRRAFFQVDGEYLGRTRNVEATILPKALRIMTPRREG